jgi:choline dehydrogenase-like flavoprotein
VSIPYQVCIVGSGFAGTFLGLRLVERGIATVIVEAGAAPDASPEGRIDLLPVQTSGDALFPVDFNRSIALGGTSRKWNGVLERLLPTDLRSRSRFGLFEDWPLAYEELEAYHVRALRALEAQPGSHRRGAEPDPVPDLPNAAGLNLYPVTFSVREAGGPSRLYDAELKRFAASPHGTILTGRTAVRLVDDGGRRILGVEVRRNDGSLEVIQARRVVLAAGVVENARLLLASSSAAFPAGIGNRRGLVGLRINAHPRPRLHVPRKEHLRGACGVFRSTTFCDAMREQGLGALCVDLNFLEQDPSIDITIETEPAAENRITLDPDRRDAWNRPLAMVHCSTTELDRRTMDAALALQQRIAGEVLLAEPGTTRVGEMKCFHPAGGCAMGRDQATGVVDRHGRVFETDNLYVAGASIFPTSGALNPTLAVVALALRLGDHLADAACR